MGRVAGGRYCLALAMRQRRDVGALAADVPGTVRPPRTAHRIGADDDAGSGAGGDDADRRRDRARLCVRPALPRFSVRFADHGGGAFRWADAAQPAAGRRAPDRGGRVCRPAGGLGALHAVQRGIGQLAIAVDVRGLFAVRGHAVAGAGRANPKMSRPIAIPDSATFESTMPKPATISPPVSNTIEGRMTCSTAMISATTPNTEFLNR